MSYSIFRPFCHFLSRITGQTFVPISISSSTQSFPKGRGISYYDPLTDRLYGHYIPINYFIAVGRSLYLSLRFHFYFLRPFTFPTHSIASPSTIAFPSNLTNFHPLQDLFYIGIQLGRRAPKYPPLQALYAVRFLSTLSQKHPFPWTIKLERFPKTNSPNTTANNSPITFPGPDTFYVIQDASKTLVLSIPAFAVKNPHILYQIIHILHTLHKGFPF